LLPSKAPSDSKFQSRAATYIIVLKIRLRWRSDWPHEIQASTWGYTRWHGLILPVLLIASLVLPFTNFGQSPFVDSIYCTHTLAEIMWGANSAHQSSWCGLVDEPWRHLVSPITCRFEIGLYNTPCK
jgi:hypothetical protein